MKLILTLGALVFASSNAFADRVDDSIQDMLNRFETAWNDRDAAAASRFFSAHARVITPTGAEGIGPQKIEGLIADDMKNFVQNGTNDFRLESKRQLGRNLYWIDLSHIITAEGRPEVKVHAVGVVVRRNNEWRFVEARPYLFVTPEKNDSAELP